MNYVNANYAQPSSTIDDEQIVTQLQNPLWPAAHTGFLYIPLDASWRPENTEFVLALNKLQQFIQPISSEDSHLQQPHQQSSSQSKLQMSQVDEGFFGDQIGFCTDDVRKRELNRVFFQNYSRILDFLHNYLSDYYRAEHQRNCVQSYLSQWRSNMNNIADTEFQQHIYLQFISYLEQRNNAFKTFYGYSKNSNYNALTNLERCLLSCLEQQLPSLKHYPGTHMAFLNNDTNHIRYYFPIVEPYMLHYPLMRTYLLYQLYLANVMRQLGNIDDAKTIYEHLLPLTIAVGAQQQNYETVFQFQEMQNSCGNTKIQTNAMVDFPDVRIPYLSCLLAAGAGNDAIEFLEKGQCNRLQRGAQTFMNSNFCRGQNYCNSCSNVSDDVSDAIFISMLNSFNDKIITMKYQEVLATDAFIRQLRIQCKFSCCNGCQQVSQGKRAYTQVKQSPSYYSAGNALIVTEPDLLDECGQHGAVQNNALQLNNKTIQQSLVEPRPRMSGHHTVDTPPPVGAVQPKKTGIQELPWQLPFGVGEGAAKIPTDIVAQVATQHEREVQQCIDIPEVAPCKVDVTESPDTTKETLQYAQRRGISTKSYNQRIHHDLGYRYTEGAMRGRMVQDVGPDHANVAALLRTYQHRDNAYVYQSPLSRFIMFGTYMNTTTLTSSFGFTQMGEVTGVRSTSFAPLIDESFFNAASATVCAPMTTSYALYTYLLLLLNRRAIWANRVARRVYETELLGRCCCGLASHIIPHDAAVGAIALGSAAQCGHISRGRTGLSLFVTQLLAENPPPPLPSLQLLYLTFQSNPMIAEYLLCFRRIPDVATMRQLFFTFTDINLVNQGLKKYHHIKTTPAAAQMHSQQLTMEAMIYTSEFGHFWQSDSLSMDIYRLAYKLQMISNAHDAINAHLYVEHRFYLQSQRLVYQQCDQFIPYAALDFLHCSYMQYIEYELKQILQRQISFNNNYLEQYGQVYQLNNSRQDVGQQTAIQDSAQTTSNQLTQQLQFSQILNSEQNISSNQNIEDQFNAIQYQTNQFNVNDYVYNIQNSNMTKSTVYHLICEKHGHSDEFRRQILCQSMVVKQNIIIRHLGDMLNILPNLKCFNIINDTNRRLQSLIPPEICLISISKQVNQLIPYFDSCYVFKRTEKASSKKSKSDKKKQQAIQQQQYQFFGQHSRSAEQGNDEAENYIADNTRSSDFFWKLLLQVPGLILNNVANQILNQYAQIQNTQLLYLQLQVPPSGNVCPDQVGGQVNFNIKQSSHSVLSKINNCITNYVQINTFDQFDNLTRFNQYLMSYHIMNYYDINVLMRSRLIRYLLRVIVYNGLDVYLLQYLSIIVTMRDQLKQLTTYAEGITAEYKQEVQQNSASRMKRIDICHVQSSLERDTGNLYYIRQQQAQIAQNGDQAHGQPQQSACMSKLLHMSSYIDHLVVQHYYRSLISNNIHSGIQKYDHRDFYNIIYARVSPQFLFCAQLYQLQRDANSRKKDQLKQLSTAYDDFMASELVEQNSFSMPHQRASYDLFYQAVLSNNSNTLFILLMMYDYSSQRLIQSLSLACYGGMHFIIRLLLNQSNYAGFESDRYPINDQISLMNKYRKTYSVSQELMEPILRQAEGQLEDSEGETLEHILQRYQLRQTIALHHILTNNQNTEIDQESAPPMYYQIESNMQCQERLKRYRQKLVEQLETVNTQIQRMEQKDVLATSGELHSTAKSPTEEHSAEIKQLQKAQALINKELAECTEHYNQISTGYNILKTKPVQVRSLRAHNECREAVMRDNQLQFHLLFQLFMNNSSTCLNNQCYFCKASQQFNHVISPSHKSRCYLQLQLMREQNYQVINHVRHLNNPQSLNNYCLQLLQASIQKTFRALVSIDQFDIFQVYIHSQSRENPITDLLGAKVQCQVLTSAPTLIALSTPFTIAAQSNTEALPPMVSYIKQQLAVPQASSDVEKFINHQDYLGLTAAQHATIVFLRLAQQMLEKQQISDKFNTIKQADKVKTAKEILQTKIMFRQAAINLKEVLSLSVVNTFVPDKQRINLRERIFAFMYHNRLLCGGVSEYIKSQEEQMRDNKLPVEMLLLCLMIFNDNVVKNTIDNAKHIDGHQKISYKRFSFQQANDDSQKLIQRRQRYSQVLNSLGAEQNGVLQIMRMSKQDTTDALHYGLNLNYHQQLLKHSGQQGVNENNVYLGNELVKYVYSELVDVLRLIFNDEKYQSQGIKDYNTYLVTQQVSTSVLAKLIPTTVNFLSFDQDVPDFKNLSHILLNNSVQTQFPTQNFMFPIYQQQLNQQISKHCQNIRIGQFNLTNCVNQEKYGLAPGEIAIKFSDFVQLSDLDQIEKFFNSRGTNMETNLHKTNYVFGGSLFKLKADNNVFKSTAESPKEQPDSWEVLTMPATRQNKYQLNYLRKYNERQMEEEQLLCMLNNIQRYAYRYFRLFISIDMQRASAVCIKHTANRPGRRHYYLQDLVHVANLRFGDLSKTCFPRLSRVQDDSALIEWRKILIRVVHTQVQTQNVKIAFVQIGERHYNQITMSDCLRISKLLDSLGKRYKLFDKGIQLPKCERQVVCLEDSTADLPIPFYNARPARMIDSGYVNGASVRNNVFWNIAMMNAGTTDDFVKKKREKMHGWLMDYIKRNEKGQNASQNVSFTVLDD